MNRPQEVVLLLAIGAVAIMVLIPPWNAGQPKGDRSKITVSETGPTEYHSIFVAAPQIWRNGQEYIPEIDTRRLAAQCGGLVILAGVMMFVLRNRRGQKDWPPRTKNQPWNAGKD